MHLWQIRKRKEEHMTKDEALRVALDALEKLFGIPDMLTGENSGDVAVWRLGGSYRTQQAITAIKEALAQPEREWVGLTDEEARVKFESWHKAEYVQPLERYGHTYKNMHVRNRWQGWLAANGIKEKNI